VVDPPDVLDVRADLRAVEHAHLQHRSRAARASGRRGARERA
jgi:hypothetical protein